MTSHSNSYRSEAARKGAITRLRKKGYNFFLLYNELAPRAIESGHTYGLEYSFADFIRKDEFRVIGTENER
jgi:hypothetical protein